MDSGDLTIVGVIEDKDGGQTEYSTTLSVNEVAPELNLDGAATATEGQVYLLTIAPTDPGGLPLGPDRIIEYKIDWGDGSGIETVPNDRTIYDHTFEDNLTGPVEIKVEARDASGRHPDSIFVTVANIAPDLQNLATAATSGAANVNEGDSVSLTGDIVDPGVRDSFTLDINWGDGKTSSLDLDARTSNFEVTHIYEDDGDYDISAVLQDDDLGSDTEMTSVTVQNVDPVITLSVDKSQILETGEVTASGSFTDVGIHDSHTVTINWGDGTV